MIVEPRKMSEEEAHDYGVGMELTRHARTLGRNHPDRSKFLHESARLRIGKRVADPDSVLKNLTEEYEIPHEIVRQRRQVHLDNTTRFEREILGVNR